MQERTVKIVVGDWSGDDHGMTETLLVKLKGKDVSDDALRHSSEQVAATVGQDLSSICEDYEEYYIAGDLFAKLQAAGFSPSNTHNSHLSITVQGSDDEFGVLELIMFYSGHHIEDFSWEEVKDELPVLLGGFDTILKENNGGSSSFGYGLFF